MPLIPESAEGKRLGEVYIGTKLIRAYPMKKRNHMADMSQPLPDHFMDQDGYRVIYDDGYRSWSPKSTFESAYRLVTNGERSLF